MIPQTYTAISDDQKKSMDKMMDIADDSWTNVRDDVKEMWNRVTDEFKKMK